MIHFSSARSLEAFHCLAIADSRWKFTKTFTLRNCLSKGRFAFGYWFGQSLVHRSMILLVPSLVLAVLVLAWIAWIAFEPRSSSQPSLSASVRTLMSVPSPEEDDSRGAKHGDNQENDYQRHVRNRIEEPQLPLGTVSGAAVPTAVRLTQRETDISNGSMG